MSDPRLDEYHLEPARRSLYRRARSELLASVGSLTAHFERAFLVRRPQQSRPRDPSQYALRDLRNGRLYPLRVGLNTVGRHTNNDIVLVENWISRRHCVLLVHARGGCEVRDTASRNGIQLGRVPAAHATLVPGAILRICNYKFLILAIDDRDATEVDDGETDIGDGATSENG